MGSAGRGGSEGGSVGRGGSGSGAQVWGWMQLLWALMHPCPVTPPPFMHAYLGYDPQAIPFVATAVCAARKVKVDCGPPPYAAGGTVPVSSEGQYCCSCVPLPLPWSLPSTPSHHANPTGVGVSCASGCAASPSAGLGQRHAPEAI